MTTPKSSLIRVLAVDPPVSLVVPYQFDKADRGNIDDQIRGCEQHLVDSLITGLVATWRPVDTGSAAVAIGDVGCVANNASGAITRAVSAALTAAGAVFGVALSAGAPGTPVRWALRGELPPSVTGLPASGNALYARCNTTTARIETVSGLLTTDFAMGTCTASGFVTFNPQLPPATITGTAGYDAVEINGGSALAARAILNFIGPTITGADNPGASRTDITITPGILSYANLTALAAATTTGFASGQLAYVVSVAEYFTLDPSSTLTPDGITIIAATSGNWLRN